MATRRAGSGATRLQQRGKRHPMRVTDYKRGGAPVVTLCEIAGLGPRLERRRGEHGVFRCRRARRLEAGLGLRGAAIPPRRVGCVGTGNDDDHHRLRRQPRRAVFARAPRDAVREPATPTRRPNGRSEAARLAYYRAEASALERARLAAALAQAGFDAPVFFQDAATFAFGSLHAADGSALVAFRGTQPDEIRHLATNLQAQQTEWTESGGRAHAGFCKAARAVLPKIEAWLAAGAREHSRLILAGHSLGAALATLAATVLRPALLVTLGSPRVGDAEFVAGLADCHTIRLVDGCDVVTQMPPALSFYAHAGAVTYITCIDAQCVDDPAPSLIEADRAEGRGRYAAEHAWKPGSVLLRELADHAPINYAPGVLRLMPVRHRAYFSFVTASADSLHRSSNRRR